MILPNFDLLCIYSKAMYILFSYTEIHSLATAYYILVLTSGRIVPGVDDAAPKKEAFVRIGICFKRFRIGTLTKAVICTCSLSLR